MESYPRCGSSSSFIRIVCGYVYGICDNVTFSHKLLKAAGCKSRFLCVCVGYLIACLSAQALLLTCFKRHFLFISEPYQYRSIKNISRTNCSRIYSSLYIIFVGVLERFEVSFFDYFIFASNKKFWFWFIEKNVSPFLISFMLHILNCRIIIIE